MFRKLRENSIYWQFRYVTRPRLAMKRWWRERRGGVQRARISTVRYRGVADYPAYGRPIGFADPRRGFAFVLVLAAIWTAISLNLGQYEGVSLGALRIALLVALAYIFARFW